MSRKKRLYADYVKPVIGWLLALIFVLLFWWLYIILAILVRTKLGSPVFFTQDRPGQIDPATGRERIFKLYKFRTMRDAVDQDGNPLPDSERLTAFGSKLRSTSLDELPEILVNILIHRDMAWIGPRPLLVSYLPWYSDRERHRHDVKPGLTGLAQVNGRNFLDWDARFELDVQYVENMSFINDIKIVFMTIGKIFGRSDIAQDTNASEGNFAEIRAAQLKAAEENENS